MKHLHEDHDVIRLTILHYQETKTEETEVVSEELSWEIDKSQPSGAVRGSPATKDWRESEM